MLDYLLPRYKVLRDAELCVQCGACERSCANEVHKVDEELGRVTADHRACCWAAGPMFSRWTSGPAR